MNGKSPAFAIFQGGGAKGIGHVGALKAIEDCGYELIGVAGASAGAIVAALVAAGHKADEIFNKDNGSLFKVHGKTPLDIIGSDAWGDLQNIMNLYKCGRFSRLFRTSTRRSVCRAIKNRGILSTDEMQRFINLLLKEKVADFYATAKIRGQVPDQIRFRDIDPVNPLYFGAETNVESVFCRLKVVVTDVDNGCPVLFDHTTPDVVVAEAVAASAALPLIFRLPKIPSFDRGKYSYADGGLVSNLPAWVFTEEKLAYERRNPSCGNVPLLAFELIEESRNRQPIQSDPIGSFLARVLRAGIVGSQLVVKDFVRDMVVISLPVNIGVLDFQCTDVKAGACYRESKRRATAGIKGIHDIDTVLADLFNRLGTRPEIKKLEQFRLCLIQPYGRLTGSAEKPKTFRVAAFAGVGNDADDRLLIDGENPGAPLAFTSRTTVLHNLRSALDAGEVLLTKYERAHIRDSIASVIAVPIFTSTDEWNKENPENRMQPLGVLCLDSDQELQPVYDSSDFMQWFIQESVTFSEAFAEGDTHER